MSSEHEQRAIESVVSDPDSGAILSTRGVSVSSRYSLFPPAEEFAGYEKAVPGSGLVILELIRDQLGHRIESEKIDQTHRHEIEHKQVDNEQNQSSTKIGCGMVAYASLLLLAVFFAFMGMENAAIASITVPALGGLASLIQSFSKKGD